MPPNERSRPAGQLGGRESGARTTAGSLPNVDDIPAQLRRRRGASYRLPVLADGRRDPLDPADDLDYDQPRNLAALTRAVDHLRELGLDVGDLVPDEARKAWPRHARDVQTELRLGVVV